MNDRVVITHSGTQFEPVNSPEYVKYCEKNHYGYTQGVNTLAGLILHKTFEPVRYFIFTHLPGFGGELPRPYADTLADGSYITPEEARQRFLNKNARLLIPKGYRGLEPPKFDLKFKG